MIRILFVDDEPKVLSGLQRMLCGLVDDWDMEFANSGREALELLAQRTFDVVISDMRMPEMDGATLLNRTRDLYPDTVRIVLSGHSERALVLRSIGATHRYLAKPCHPEELRGVVTRAVKLRSVLASSSLRSLVSRLSRIPSAPRLYQDIVNQVQTSDKSLRDLGRSVAQDIGMTAKILQIVNSAFFGLPCHVSDPVHATCLLGLDVLKALILTAHIFSELAPEDLKDIPLDALWDHSTRTGAIARNIAAAEGCERHLSDHALMAGLLHDIGKLILAVNLPDQYRKVLSIAAPGSVKSLTAEKQVFGATHAEVGAYLLGLWGLPDATVEAVAFHHRPAECVAAGFAPVTAVHLADALDHERHLEEGVADEGRIDLEYLARLNLTERLGVWRERCLADACGGRAEPAAPAVH